MPHCICWLFQGQPVSQAQAGRLMKSQVWTGVYTVILVEGQDMPDCGQGDIYVRFRLGDQRVRSKVSSSLSPFIFLLLLLSLFPVLITSSRLFLCFYTSILFFSQYLIKPFPPPLPPAILFLVVHIPRFRYSVRSTHLPPPLSDGFSQASLLW